MTRSSNSAQSTPPYGLFRPGDHVVVIGQGSAIAILDLERALVYASTPFGAESWAALTGTEAVPYRAVAEGDGNAEVDEGAEARGRIAEYLLGRGIIEAVVSRASEG